MKGKKRALLMIVSAGLAVACAFPAVNLMETLADEVTQTTNVTPSEAWNPVESVIQAICSPSAILPMEDGSMLVSDTYSKVIWKIKDGTAEIFAGKSGVTDPYGQPVGGYRDAALLESYFGKPWAMAKFSNGIVVSDSANHVIRYIGPNGVETVVGNGTAGYRNGHGTNTAFYNPTGLATDSSGNLYIADTNNNAIRKVTRKGVVTTFLSDVIEPTGLYWQGGILYVVESGMHRILKVKNGEIVEMIGTGIEGDVIGKANVARFSYPQGVTVSADGVIYVSDTGNGAVKKIADGNVTTLLAYASGEMSLYPISPMGLAVKEDKLYVCDNFAKKIMVLNR